MNLFSASISLVVFCIGVFGAIVKKNLIMKLLALNVVNTSSILFFIALLYKPGTQPPIHGPQPGPYADPLPQALTLTAIVINFGVLALSLIFTMVIVQNYHTLDTDKIEREATQQFQQEEDR